MLNANEWSISLSDHFRALEAVRRGWLPVPLPGVVTTPAGHSCWQSNFSVTGRNPFSSVRFFFPADFRRILGLMPQLVSHVLGKFQVGPVCIATRCGLDGPGIESQCRRDFPHPSRPALWPTQPPIQWVPGLPRG